MAIQENFIPNLFGAQVDSLEADSKCKPSRYGGMGILNPVETALPQFLASVKPQVIYLKLSAKAQH